MDPESTESAAYTGRLTDLEQRWIRRVIDVQAPYRWNLRRLDLGFVLDVGCGLGRNLGHVDGHGIGVDHNPHSVEVVRSRGMTAFTPEEFLASKFAVPGRFDSLLSAHVLEHHVGESDGSSEAARRGGEWQGGGVPGVAWCPGASGASV